MKSAVGVSLFAVTAVIGLLLGGCSSSGSSSSGGLPSASDGTNLQACASGTCVVQVGPSAQIPLPSTYRVESLQVQSIAPDSVTLTGRKSFNTSPNCRRNCRSSSSNGDFQFTFSTRGEGTVDKLDVTLVGTDGKQAVLRIVRNARS
jgi:hypothetical protein